jgi:hypothetical protein
VHMLGMFMFHVQTIKMNNRAQRNGA